MLPLQNLPEAVHKKNKQNDTKNKNKSSYLNILCLLDPPVQE